MQIAQKLLVVFMFFIILRPDVGFAATCSVEGYFIPLVNGIDTTEPEAQDNTTALHRLLPAVYKNQSIVVDYLYNPTHNIINDSLDVVRQKMFESVDMSDPDFLQMWNDASLKVQNQKVLLVAHSQGNLYANNLYDVAVRPGSLTPASVGVYSIATPANHVGGNGEYITSDTDKVISNIAKDALVGKVLPANTHIPYTAADGDSMGHNLIKIYLPYSGDAIREGIMRSLSKLSSDGSRSESTPCIQQPQEKSTLTALIDSYKNLGETELALAASVPSAVVFSFKTFTYQGAVDIAKIIANDVGTLATAVKDIFASLLSGSPAPTDNTASVIDALQSSPQANLQQNTTDNTPTQAVPQLVIVDDTNTQANTQGEPVAQAPVSSSLAATSSIAVVEQPPVATSSVITIANPLPSGGGGGAVRSSQDAQDVAVDKNADIKEDSPAPTSAIFHTSAVISATTTAPSYLDTPVTFAGEYYNSVAFDTITFELKNTTLDTATTTINFSAQATTTDAVLQFSGEAQLQSAGTWEYRVRLEDSVNASSTPWLESDTFIFEFATTTATSTPDITPVTPAIVFETPNPANLLRSDLNRNGIADSEEENVVVSATQSLSPGEYVFHNLTITNKAQIIAEGNQKSTNVFKGVKIFADNLTINAGASLSADTQGYDSSGVGPGTNLTGKKGASYGGVGVWSEGKYQYGSAFEPTDLGSGGGSSCCSRYLYGGGAIRLVVSGTLVNDGVVSSNGQEAGSGGSVYISSGVLSGAGKFQANGGKGTAYGVGGSGGGGRIAVYYEHSSYLGSIEALGGSFYDGWCCTSRAGSGSVLLMDVPKNDIIVSGNFVFKNEKSPYVFNQIIATSSAAVSFESGVNVKAKNLKITKNSAVSVPEGMRFEVPTVVVEDHSTLSLSGDENLVADTISVVGTSLLTTGEGKILRLLVGNLILEKGSSISVDQKGKAKWLGSGDFYYTGGSYGGVGLFNTATSTYGSKTEPIDFGSGGASRGIGGGAMRIKVMDTFENNGVVSSNGAETSSGGSIYITTNKLAGNGSFVANGGTYWWSGRYWGMGGGGRIAVYYTTSTFSGTAQANGACATFDSWTKTCSANGTVVMSDVLPRHLSSEKAIINFSVQVATSTVSGVIDEATHTVNLTVPFGTNVGDLPPNIGVSSFATSTPGSNIPKDFSSPVIYTVTAEDGTTQTYTIVVAVAPDPTPRVLSSEKIITEFNLLLASSTVPGVVDELAHTVSVTVPFGTDIHALVPVIVVSSFATTTPAGMVAQDFTNPVEYIVTAEDGTTQTYSVLVAIEPAPVVVLPEISNYTFNGGATDITVDFATTTPAVELIFVANKNVDWVSVTIENQTNTAEYKRFLSGAGCVDGTTTCTKTWDGSLSVAGGGVASDGTYQIKAHIRDVEGNDFNEYLSPHHIIVNRALPSTGAI